MMSLQYEFFISSVIILSCLKVSSLSLFVKYRYLNLTSANWLLYAPKLGITIKESFTEYSTFSPFNSTISILYLVSTNKP